jgi:hypothetical protein
VRYLLVLDNYMMNEISRIRAQVLDNSSDILEVFYDIYE